MSNQRPSRPANGRQVVKHQADTVRAALEKLKPQLALALPKHLTPDRLLRVVMTAVQNTPKLLDCERTSLFAAVMTSAQLGLEPDGVLGQAFLVPFNGRVQFLPGYKGYIRLAYNSGEMKSLNAHAVRDGDDFSYSYGLEEHLHHVPAEDNEESPITHFYAYAKFQNGGHVFVVMTRAKVDHVRDTKSEGYRAFKAGKIKSNPWDTDYEEMGCKTAIRKLAKYLPLSVQRAAAIDAAYESGKHATVDNFGDVVIEGEGQEITEPENGGNKAASKLDALAGEKPDPATETPERESPAEATNGKGKPRAARLAKNTPARFQLEDGEVVDMQTGEIVPERHLAWDDDGEFMVRDTYNIKQKEQVAGAGLFGAEG